MHSKYSTLSVVLLLMSLSGPVTAQQESFEWPACGAVDAYPGSQWVTNEEARSQWSDLSAAIDAFDALESESLMVVHRGNLVLSLGDVAVPRMLASLRKSVLSSLFGAYSSDHAIDVHLTLEQLGINDSQPQLTAHERQATIENLLLARSGILHSAHYEVGGWKTEKRHAREWAMGEFGRPSVQPGRLWLYNNWDFNVLASVYQRISGESLAIGMQQRIAGPLGFQDFDAEHVSFVGRENYAERRMGNSSDHPAYMFHMSSRDLARIGLLYLSCGQWKGEQIVPDSWVRKSIEGVPIAQGAPRQSKVHTFYGDYGWQWWVDKPDQRRTFWKMEIEQPVFFGQGYRGHYIWVAPYLDLVVVHQVATKGGLGTVSQLRRRFLGSPEVTDQQFQVLLTHIIAAHPDS